MPVKVFVKHLESIEAVGIGADGCAAFEQVCVNDEVLKVIFGQEFFDAKVSVLSEMIKHHVKEEEKRSEGLFAQARDAGLDVEALGERMKQRKEELLAEIKAGGLPTPETRSFTGHKLAQGEPVHGSAD